MNYNLLTLEKIKAAAAIWNESKITQETYKEARMILIDIKKTLEAHEENWTKPRT